MESQLERQQGHHDYDQESHASGMHGHEGHDHGGHHDKKPVGIMQKVKDNAKKVTDKIKKSSQLHGNDQHGHDHGDQHHISDDRDSYEKEGKEEMVESPEVHGAPMYDSEKTGSPVAKQMETSGHTGTNIERPNNPSVVKQETNPGMHAGRTRHSVQDNSEFSQSTDANPNIKLGREMEESPGESRLNLNKPVVDSAAPKSQTADSTASNYQSKVSNPTDRGREEIGTGLIDQSMGKMSIHDTQPDVPNKTREGIYRAAPTGSHDQFSPELAPARPQNTESQPETFNATKLAGQPHDSITEDRPSNLRSYTPTHENPQHDRDTYDANEPRKQEKQSRYTDQFSSASSAVADKAVAAKDSVASKLGDGGVKGHAAAHGDGAEKNVNTEHSQGGQVTGTQTNQSGSYIRKISSVAAAVPAVVAGTAMSAKDVAASKLGYGRKDDGTPEHKMPGEEQHRHSSGSGAEHYKAEEKDQGSTYAGKISSSAAAIPAAVTGIAQGEKHNARPVSATKPEMTVMAKDQDKGVPAKGYFSEKLKPGDEDKALSELISESLHLKKKDAQKEKHEEKPIGKVTESEEVKKGLGTSEGKSAEKVQSSFINAPGGKIVNKLKGWFGPLAPQQSATSTPGQDSGHDSNIGGEGRLQESGN